MIKKFWEYLSKCPKWIAIVFAILVLGLVLFSCQGLFNVNAKESKVDVSLVDSLKLGGNNET